jgi:hypothetical protein
MRRTLMAVLTPATLALALPAMAAAHRSHHHHARTHKHASSARILRFGSARAALAPTTTSPTSQSPTPTPPEEPAGKVVSYKEGVLTIMLKGGSTVSGKVTEETKLRCQSATPPPESEDDPGEDQSSNEGQDQNGGQNEGGDQGGGSDSGQFAGQHSDSLAHSADVQGGDEGGSQENCTAATVLTEGAVVLEAELKISGAGAFWEQLVVVH